MQQPYVADQCFDHMPAVFNIKVQATSGLPSAVQLLFSVGTGLLVVFLASKMLGNNGSDNKKAGKWDSNRWGACLSQPQACCYPESWSEALDAAADGDRRPGRTPPRSKRPDLSLPSGSDDVADVWFERPPRTRMPERDQQ